MRVTVVGLIVMSFLISGMAQASPISTWGKWDGTNNANNFTLTRANVEWKASENNTTTAQAGSGGEWFDIEHLFVDVVTKRDVITGFDETYLEWLLITSYPGVEPTWTNSDGEWIPNWNWDGVVDGAGDDYAGQLRPGNGRNAGLRDNRTPPGNSTNWAYRQNPVLAFDLYDTDETSTSGPIFDWALVLDSSEAENQSGLWSGTPYDITTQAALYRVKNVANFVEWVPPEPTQFPQAKISDLNSSNIADSDKWTMGTSIKRFADERTEAPDAQTYPNYWRMDFNWYWTGSMQLTDNAGLIDDLMPMENPDAFDPSGQTSVHYAMWCGNDYIDASANGYSDEETPELSSGMLLLLGALPVGLAWRRRRRDS